MVQWVIIKTFITLELPYIHTYTAKSVQSKISLKQTSPNVDRIYYICILIKKVYKIILYTISNN